MATSLSSSSSSSSSSSATMELTDKEAEQYDRQIRLWGAEAQKRMRNSCMLIIGCNGLGAEIIKNIVLAGISIIIIDDQFVQENDLETQFFLTQSDIGQNRALASLNRIKDLNPLVDVKAYALSPSVISNDLITQCRGTIICNIDETVAISLANRCHNLHVPVIMASGFGFYGFFFVDYGKHYSYQSTKIVPGVKPGDDYTSIEETNIINFPCLDDVLQYNQWSSINPRYLPPEVFAWIALQNAIVDNELTLTPPLSEGVQILLKYCHKLKPSATVSSSSSSSSSSINASTNKPSPYVSEQACTNILRMRNILIAPVVAILGGLIGTEIIKLISGKDEPVYNTFVLDAMGSNGGVVFYLNGKE